MEVILLERVDKLGQMGQVVKVKPGYARNYLLPKKKAMRATKGNLAYFQSQKSRLEATNLERKKEAEFVAGKMTNLSVVVLRQAGESGVLYGSVAARDIAEAVTAAGYGVGRTQVPIDQPIKTLGLFPVRVLLHPEVSVTVTVNVARSADEAQIQAQRGGMVTPSEMAEEEEAAASAEEAAEPTAEAD